MTGTNEQLEKLYRLDKQLLEVKAMKKSMAKDYRDQIKDIEGEIKDLMLAIEDGGTGKGAKSKKADKGGVEPVDLN